MPKKKKAKTKRKIRKLRSRKTVKQEENVRAMFDSKKGSIDNLFSAGEDLTKEKVITFADFKKENLEKLEEELKAFDIKFLSEGAFVMPEAPVKMQFEKSQKKRFRNLSSSILMGLVFVGLFSIIIYVFALPVFQDAKVSILKNSEELKAGLPSSRVQTFTANLFVPVDNLFGFLFRAE